MSFKKLSLLGVALLAVVSVSGCTRAPNIYDITPSQTAFGVPVQGDTKQQEKFSSSKFLKSKQIAGKRVTINYHKEYWGTGFHKYNWVPDNYLYLVDRMAVSREWTAKPEPGSTTNDDALRAVSKESIRFGAPANCVAEIQENDAATYLYYYGALAGDKDNKYVFSARKLEDVLDKEIRIKVAGKFAEECAKYPLRELVTKKDVIFEAVRRAYIPYFKTRGITITALALQGDFEYEDKRIQEAFDKQFTSKQEAEAQKNSNQRALEKAQTDLKVARMMASSDSIAVLRRLDNERFRLETERMRVEKWNGQEAPRYGIYQPGSIPPQPADLAIPQSAGRPESMPAPEAQPSETR